MWACGRRIERRLNHFLLLHPIGSTWESALMALSLAAPDGPVPQAAALPVDASGLVIGSVFSMVANWSRRANKGAPASLRAPLFLRQPMA